MNELELAKAVISEIDAEIAAAERHAVTLRIKRTGAEAVLHRLQQPAQPSTTTGTSQPRPRDSISRATGNTDLVTSILASSDGAMHLSEIETAARVLGRQLNNEQVRSAVTLLRKKGRAAGLGRGYWRLAEGVTQEHPIDTEPPAATEGSVGDRSNSEDRSPHPKGVMLNGTASGGDQDGSSARPTEHQDHPDGASVVGGAV